MQELVGDVGQHGGAARRNAALGDQDEKAGQEFEDVVAGFKLGEIGEEFGGEVFGIIGSGLEGKARGDLTVVVAEAKARLGGEAREDAATAVGVAEVAAGGIVERKRDARALLRGRGRRDRCTRRIGSGALGTRLLG